MGRDSKERKRKNAMRKHARKKAARILERDGGKCHWCRRDLVRMADIPPERLLACTDRVIRWTGEDGHPRQALAMTLDHIAALGEGGTNRDENLVASCKSCNEARGKGGRTWERRQAGFGKWLGKGS